MNAKELKTRSKFLSLVLRHKPESIDLILDENGWVEVATLLEKSGKHGVNITPENLVLIVETNDKKRFSFSSDKTKIRANQGHSIDVDLQLSAAIPPALLFHGTATKNIDSIKENGLTKGNRHHVHLSSDEETAMSVGRRYGKPVLVRIDTEKMLAEGFEFFRSENGVWLVDHVPAVFIRFE